MSERRIWHASDLHLGASGGPDRRDRAAEAWSRFAMAVDEHRPDLVVLTGDLVVDDPDDRDDHRTAYDCISALPVPVRVVPGNHDVGDHAVRRGLPADWHGKLVTASRVRDWERLWGPSSWIEEVAGRVVIGLNAQIIGSGLAAEREQWAWLSTLAERCVEGRAVLVFLHEALVPSRGGLPSGDTTDTWMAVPTDAGAQMLHLLSLASSLTVASGHTHRAYSAVVDGVRHVSAPSLAGPIPPRTDMVQALGEERAGWLEFVLAEDGRVSVEVVTEQGGGGRQHPADASLESGGAA